MTDPIRAALERLIYQLLNEPVSIASIEQWTTAATVALSHPAPPAEGEVSDEEIKDIAMQRVHGHKSLEWAIKQGIALDRSRRAPVQPAEGEVADGDDWFTVALLAQDMRSRGLAEQVAGDELLKMANCNRSRRAPVQAADALAARPLLEQVARMGDRIGQHTVREIMAISDRAASWLRENPPGQPAPPAEGEVGELVRRLGYAKQNGNSIPSGVHWGLDDGTEHQGSISVGSNHAADCSRAAELLQQRHPQPVSVSERLPGPDDCDAEGRCWWEFAGSDEFGPSWTLVKMHGIPSDMTRWLPVWVRALPTPTTPPEAKS